MVGDRPATSLVAFPPGSTPRLRRRPARQLPLPEVAVRPGLSCPPGDHPERPDDPVHLIASPERPPLPVAVALTDTRLLHGWDPLGPGSEHELARRFTVRDATPGLPAEHFWPPAEAHPEGAVGWSERAPVVLEPGTGLDLLGGLEHRVTAAADTPFRDRSLPTEHADTVLHRLVVREPVAVWEVAVVGWFAQPGAGVRYRLPAPAAELLAAGVLEPRTEERPGG